MKKTQLIEIGCLVRKTLVPFLSIVLFVAMGITLYAGMTWTERAFQDRLDEALDQGNMYDFQIVSKLGLTDDDLNELRQISGISTVEPGYVSYQSIKEANNSLCCSVYSMTDQISTVELVSGTLPTHQNEIALLWNCNEACPYGIGSTITFEQDGDDISVNDGMQFLSGSTYTITGYVSSCNYLSNAQSSLGVNEQGQQIVCVFYTTKDAFLPDAFDNTYPLAYLNSNDLYEFNTFEDGYSTLSKELRSKIESVGTTLAENRYRSLKDRANASINDGQSQLDEAQIKITEGEAQLDSGTQQLAEKKAEWAQGQADLNTAIQQLNAQTQSATTQIAQTEEEITTSENKLAEYQELYREAEEEIAYQDAQSHAMDTLSANATTRLTALETEITEHTSDADFTTWYTTRCTEVNAETNQEVAEFKESYPTRSEDTDALLDGLTVNPASTDLTTQKASALGLSTKAATIQSETVVPGKDGLAQAKVELDKMSANIATAKEQLASGRAQYNQQVAEGQSRIADGQDQLAAGKEQISAAESQLAQGQSDLAAAKAEYANGQAELQNAKDKASQIKPSDWVVNQRTDSYACQILATTCQTLSSLRLSMALLFVIVGLLVCYTVMSRLVHEHLAQLGTKKALGFTLTEISKQFLGYALLASVIGTVLGALIGGPIVEIVIIPKMNQYMFADPGFVYQFVDIIPVSLFQIVLICLSAWIACRSVLKKNAVELLAGHAPSAAKRRFYENWSAWNRMSLLNQTMITNCFNDKRRAFGTLVGVAGCTALIVCAMTLQASIQATAYEQEQVVERFDQVVFVHNNGGDSDTSQEQGTQGNMDSLIESTGCSYLKAMYGMQTVDLPDNSKTYITLVVPENMNELANVMTLNMTNGNDDLERDGAYISSAMADYYHYAVGDQIEFSDSDGAKYVMPVAGIFEYYGGTHVAIMSTTTYQTYYGTDPSYTARLVSLDGQDNGQFNALVESATDFNGISNTRAITHAINDAINNLALTVVAIYIGISALVALFVLLNLDIMYITEKKRELIVMMINGYDIKDAKRYVSRDTIVMNAIGMIIGCLLGTGMGILAVQSMQNDRLSFLWGLGPLAWIVGIVMCSLFSLIVMRIALRRVDEFKLSSIND